jgi:hypothetical protein
MAFDRDGTVGVHVNIGTGSVITTLTGSQMAGISDESLSDGFSVATGSSGTFALVLLFPEARDFVAYHLNALTATNGSWNELQWSNNTTNGVDGTWTTVETIGVSHESVPAMRTAIRSISVTGATALRFKATASGGTTNRRVLALHLYGSPSTGANPDRLRLWHPTLDQEVGGAHFDWGDVARSTVLTKTFRVKNNSATLTANSIALSMEAPTDTSPTNVSAHKFSPDGSTFTSTLNIGNLAPGAISSVVTLQRDTSSVAALSLWWTRIVASASSWT